MKEYIFNALSQMLEEQKQEDYILYGDILQLQILPILVDVQNAIRDSGENLLETYWEQNMAALKDKDEYLYQQMINCEVLHNNSPYRGDIYSIEAALGCSYIDCVVVSTDSERIAEVERQSGARVPFLRPEALAGDTSKTIDCMIYTIKELEKMGEVYDYVMLLQPTQLIRTREQLCESVETLVNSDEDSLVSVCEVEEHPILMRKIDETGKLVSLLGLNSTVRRQDFPTVYKVNGSIYINAINEHFNLETSLNDNVLPHVMDRAYSVDIDSMEDLERAERLMKHI